MVDESRTGATGAALDSEALARLAELDPSGSGELVRRVLGTYAGSLGRLGDQLHQARAAGDHAALRYVTHTLKSSSASVGAMELSRLCADVERRVREGETADLEPLLQALTAELARVHAEVGRRLAG